MFEMFNNLFFHVFNNPKCIDDRFNYKLKTFILLNIRHKLQSQMYLNLELMVI